MLLKTSNLIIKLAKNLQLDGEIVSCVTEDNITLYGLYRESLNSDRILAYTHGTASAYGIESFEGSLNSWAKDNGWEFLSFNNRGAHVLEDWQKTGAAVEKFSDSSLDIDAWIKFLKLKGIKEIILCGHSLGTEKIVNFIRENSNQIIKKLLLLSPSDTVGCQERWEKKSKNNYMKQAQKMKLEGKETDLLPDLKVHSGLLPMSAEAYLDFYSKDSQLRKSLPFRLDSIEKISTPTWAIIPKKDIWNITSPKDYELKLKNIGVTTIMVNATHDLDFNILPILESLKGLL